MSRSSYALRLRTRIQFPCAWFTVKIWPAIDSVPIRAGPVFAPLLKVTVPLPVCVAPAVTVIQGSLLVAVHVHPMPLVMAVEPNPPAAPIDCDGGDIREKQPLA